MRKLRGFTLVELLAVVAIIALLIGILLPVLGSARKKAATIKCASALRELGNAFQMYSLENKGYYPPANHYEPYSLYGGNYPIADSAGVLYYAHWFNFLEKYVTKMKTGVAATDAQSAAFARNTVIWGCPAWDGYPTGTTAGVVNRLQTGYGMNAWPSYRANNYVDSTPPNNEIAISGTAGALALSPPGAFQKTIEWRPPAETCLVADSIAWLAKSGPPPAAGPYPPAVTAQGYNDSSTPNSAMATLRGPNMTLIDIYRHGKFPKQIGGNRFDPNGGKIIFNVLYADGHAATANEAQEAYRCIRKKFPG